MSMYRPYSNVCFNNCYDFIMKSKAEKEVWELSTSLTFDDEEEMRWELDRISDLTRDIMNAEYDLCEMEMDALYDAEEYDNILNGNAFRSSKRAQRRKANIRHHKADRRHGKSVPQSDKKYWDEQSGTYYRWDEKKKTFFSPKKPKVHRNKKTFRDRLNHSMREREIDFLSAMEILDRSNAIFFQAKEETDPIRQKQLEDTAYELLCAGCVDFYHGAVTGHKGTYFPDLAVGI